MSVETSWELRVKRLEDDAAKVYTRQQEFTVGTPLSFDREYDGTTALETALGALGADLVNGLAFRADRERIELDAVEATIEAELDNALTYLDVVGEEGHPGLERIEIKVFVSSLAPEDEIRDLWSKVQRLSPLLNTLGQSATIESTLEITV
jgi:uncharacterized OsmC-like protein